MFLILPGVVEVSAGSKVMVVNTVVCDAADAADVTGVACVAGAAAGAGATVLSHPLFLHFPETSPIRSLPLDSSNIRGDVKIPHSRMTKTCSETLVTESVVSSP